MPSTKTFLTEEQVTWSSSTATTLLSSSFTRKKPKPHICLVSAPSTSGSFCWGYMHTKYVFTSSLCPCFPWQKGMHKEGSGGPSWGPCTLPQRSAFYSPLLGTSVITVRPPLCTATDLCTFLCYDSPSLADWCSLAITSNISEVKLLINSACWILQWNLCGRRWLTLRMPLHILALQFV